MSAPPISAILQPASRGRAIRSYDPRLHLYPARRAFTDRLRGLADHCGRQTCGIAVGAGQDRGEGGLPDVAASGRILGCPAGPSAGLRHLWRDDLCTHKASARVSGARVRKTPRRKDLCCAALGAFESRDRAKPSVAGAYAGNGPSDLGRPDLRHWCCARFPATDAACRDFGAPPSGNIAMGGICGPLPLLGSKALVCMVTQNSRLAGLSRVKAAIEPALSLGLLK